MTRFEKVIKPLTSTKHLWQIWADWTYLAASAISNSMDFRQDREDQYKKIVAQYDDTDLQIMAELLAIVTEELEENPEQDYLGSLYMTLGLSDHWKGQFFTPYSVCRAMAETTIPKNIIEVVDTKGYIKIADSACGGGATLIAAYNVAKAQLEKIGRNAQNHILVIAQDISLMTACMCYIQLSLLGISAIVKVGNSLLNPIVGNWLLMPHTPDLWFTPMYNFPAWGSRRTCAMLDFALQGKRGK